jgi:phage gp16-like protein
MFKAIHIKKYCVEISYMLSNRAGEAATTKITKKHEEKPYPVYLVNPV